jgi:hypothetical protein
MAITTKLGGIRTDEHRITTVMPISMLMDFTISGLAFESKEKVGEDYDHLDNRVRELGPARGAIQRNFYARAMKEIRYTDPETGERKSRREPTAWSPTRKYVNATGDLLHYVQGAFLDTPPFNAALPPFILYAPEPLRGTQREGFDAHMGGEFFTYDVDPTQKFMLADGESRHLAIDISLAPRSRLSGSRREKLKSIMVTVEIIHGIPPEDMGQIFADFNGKGVTLTKNEVNGKDVRDPWARATKEIFSKLSVPLQESGRQITAVAMAENKHLTVGAAITMVRAVGLGSYSKAVSTTTFDEVLKDPAEYEKLVNAGVEWFRFLLDHFKMGEVDGVRSAEIFTDPDRVLRAMPIKVALGVMGNAWFAGDVHQQRQHVDALGQINWKVGPEWSGIAGKVSEKIVTQTVAGDYQLAASGAKEIGTKVVRALTSPTTTDGELVRRRRESDPQADTEEVDEAALDTELVTS